MLRSATLSIVVICLAFVSDAPGQTSQPLFGAPPVAWETLPKGHLWANYCTECRGVGCGRCRHHARGCSDCDFSCLGLLSGRCHLLDFLLGRDGCCDSCGGCDSCSGGAGHSAPSAPAPANAPKSNQGNGATQSPSDVPPNNVPQKNGSARTVPRVENRAAPSPPNVVVETDPTPVPPVADIQIEKPQKEPAPVQLAPANPVAPDTANATDDDSAPKPAIVPPVKVEVAKPKEETTEPASEQDDVNFDDVPNAEIPQNEIPPNQIPGEDDATPGQDGANMVRKPNIKRVSAEIIQSPRPLSHWIKL